MTREDGQILLKAICDRDYMHIFNQLPFKLFDPSTKITYTVRGVSVRGLETVCVGRETVFSEPDECWFGGGEYTYIVEDQHTISFDDATSMWVANDATERQLEWYKSAIDHNLDEASNYDIEHLYLLSKEEAWNAINHYVNVAKSKIVKDYGGVARRKLIREVDKWIDSVSAPDGEINGYFIPHNDDDEYDEYF